MGGFFLTLGLVAIFAGLGISPIRYPGIQIFRRPLITLGVFLVLFSPVAAAAVIIPPGHRGVVTWLGSVENRVLGEGFSLLVPFAEQATQVDVRVQPHNFKQIEAASSEYQSVKLTGTMNFHLDPRFVNDLYQRVGLDFANKVIDPAFEDFIKEVMPSYSIGEILPKRDEIRRKAVQKLGANLERYHIIIDDIYIANIAFSQQYTQAIEEKQTQQQRVETERQILAQKEVQAKQRVAEAQGEAEANVVRAKGEASATVARAQGQTEANQRIAASLTPEVIQWEYVRQLTDKIQVMLLPSSQGYLFDVKGLMGGGGTGTQGR